MTIRYIIIAILVALTVTFAMAQEKPVAEPKSVRIINMNQPQKKVELPVDVAPEPEEKRTPELKSLEPQLLKKLVLDCRAAKPVAEATPSTSGLCINFAQIEPGTIDVCIFSNERVARTQLIGAKTEGSMLCLPTDSPVRIEDIKNIDWVLAMNSHKLSIRSGTLVRSVLRDLTRGKERKIELCLLGDPCLNYQGKL